MTTIHWLGAGLSSVPGIHRLAGGKLPLVLWNRTPDRARSAVAGLATPPPVRALDMSALAEATRPGDILVSMLPAERHLDVARLALASGAHFVSSSYIAPDMQALHEQATAANLCLVNEVGLDPGLDHLMAHQLVHRYREAEVDRAGLRLSFRSWCGGFPARANPFRYKFSWSPVGVLRALRAPSRCIRNGVEQEVARPWLGLSRYCADLPGGAECFESYANRDSMPFIAQYGLEPEWELAEFVRGTLRLEGWSDAWAPLFEEIETLEGDDGEADLQALGARLWEAHRYAPGEPDRVVLCVELEASDERGCQWHEGLCLDARGSAQYSAMGRLVSHTVSLAIESVAAGRLPPGVSAAPSDPALIAEWFTALESLGDRVYPLPRYASRSAMDRS